MRGASFQFASPGVGGLFASASPNKGRRSRGPESPRRDDLRDLLKQELLVQRPDYSEGSAELPLSSPASKRGVWHFCVGERPANGVIYGLVNWIACVPTLVSYCHIVFPNSRFTPVLPLLVKLYFFSSAVHQVMFLLLSTLPFAIGQIQDVGLIFLASMVRNLVKWADENNWTEAELVATCLWQCALSTIAVGVCVVVVAKLRLGKYVQMLPLPVVAGYLAYIGYFCFVAGLASTTNLELGVPSSLLQLLDWQWAPKLGLLLVMTVLLLIVRFKVDTICGVPGMPLMLTLLPLGFFVALHFLGVSAEECRATGWLPPPVPAAEGPAVFEYFAPGSVKWEFISRQWISVVGLIIVVFFGSSLDVAAIQAEMGSEPLDFDAELNTIGWGNIISGVTGGATGSYIFSQTIFSAKLGVKSRLNGLIVAVGELVLFFTDIDVLRVLPNAYIGAIMCLFGIDIMLDWIVHSRSLMAPAEYGLVWISFAVIVWLSTKSAFGVIEGMAVGSVFATSYFAYKYAAAQRNWEVLVNAHSAVICRPLKERVVLDSLEKKIFAVTLRGFSFFGSSLTLADSLLEEAMEVEPHWVCIDFRLLAGVDSTAAGQLRFIVQQLQTNRMKVALSSLVCREVKHLLIAHGIVEGDDALVSPDLVFETIEDALKHSENDMLRERGIHARTLLDREERLEDIFQDYIDLMPRSACDDARGALAKYFDRQELRPRDMLFDHSDKPEEIYFIVKGRLCMHYEKPPLISQRALPGNAGDPEDSNFIRIHVGEVLGDAAFFGRETYGYDAVADADGCIVYGLPVSKVAQLEKDDLAASYLLHKIFLYNNVRYQRQYLVPKA